MTSESRYYCRDASMRGGGLEMESVGEFLGQYKYLQQGYNIGHTGGLTLGFHKRRCW